MSVDLVVWTLNLTERRTATLGLDRAPPRRVLTHTAHAQYNTRLTALCPGQPG